MRRINIVLFSSGESERNGMLDDVINGLTKKGYNTFCWRDLFGNANNTDNVALLPTLIKKIPTFDFAVLIGEGHDTSVLVRNKEEFTYKTMRDNVLFEIGLCSMALGLSKVILLSESDVRLPDDLVGLNGKLAIKHIIWNDKSITEIDKHIKNNLGHFKLDKKVFDDIDLYINDNKLVTSPVVIGAAASTAVGYATNFIIRLLESVEDGFTCEGNFIDPDLENIFMHIIVPLESETYNIKEQGLKEGIIKKARHREISFKFKKVDNNIHIYDYPSSIVTSYDTAKMILDIEADEKYDMKAKERFYQKELDLFEATLRNILNEKFVKDIIYDNYKEESDDIKNKKINNIMYIINNNLTIDRRD